MTLSAMLLSTLTLPAAPRYGVMPLVFPQGADATPLGEELPLVAQGPVISPPVQPAAGEAVAQGPLISPPVHLFAGL